MDDTLTILHLSDTHIGHPKHRADARDVLEALLTDLRSSHPERPPDLILFNGDLAYGQIPEKALSSQYDEARQWLSKVHDAVGDRDQRIPLIFVPGNHDVNRTRIGHDQSNWLSSVRDPEVLYREMLDNTVQWRRYLERQQEWVSFVSSYPPSAPFKLNTDLNVMTGVVPLGGRSIGVAALNTSWASHKENEAGLLWLGRYQVQYALEELERCSFKIVATHHPVAWLNPAEQGGIEQRIQAGFQMHLHGHVHDQWIIPIEGHLRIQAGACYSGSKQRENAYSWIDVNFEHRSVKIRFRRFEEKGQSGWTPMHIPGKTDPNAEFHTECCFKETLTPQTSRIKVHPPVSNQPSSYSQPKAAGGVITFLDTLERRFSFRWERGTFCDRGDEDPIVVYWPVRLRPATAIHAVQAFAAAHLLRRECKVILCLDDLGNLDENALRFTGSIKRWFRKQGAAADLLEVKLFSSIITESRSAQAWALLQSWMADPRYKMEDILSVSKLWTHAADLKAFTHMLARRPRRLLTPALVWTCLLHLAHDFEGHRFLTLSGYDEQQLWAAWRACNSNNTAVGHLYIPELTESESAVRDQALHMARTGLQLVWESWDDVSRALKSVIDRDDAFVGGNLIPWTFTGCVALPHFLNDSNSSIRLGGQLILRPQDLVKVDKDLLVRDLASEITTWIL
jgi:predicted MPP superfamily phosphohydrolase